LGRWWEGVKRRIVMMYAAEVGLTWRTRASCYSSGFELRLDRLTGYKVQQVTR
jgi:hypothetical protein